MMPDICFLVFAHVCYVSQNFDTHGGFMGIVKTWQAKSKYWAKSWKEAATAGTPALNTCVCSLYTISNWQLALTWAW